MLLSATNVPAEVLREIIEASSKAATRETWVEPVEIFEGQLSLFDLIYVNGEMQHYEVCN